MASRSSQMTAPLALPPPSSRGSRGRSRRGRRAPEVRRPVRSTSWRRGARCPPAGRRPAGAPRRRRRRPGKARQGRRRTRRWQGPRRRRHRCPPSPARSWTGRRSRPPSRRWAAPPADRCCPRKPAASSAPSASIRERRWPHTSRRSVCRALTTDRRTRRVRAALRRPRTRAAGLARAAAVARSCEKP